MIKNYGLDLEKEKVDQSEQDWLFGSSSKQGAVLIPKNEITSYLPTGEVQRGVEDTMDCATRAPINIIETKLNYLFQNALLGANAEWLIDNDFVNDSGCIEISDAFNAIKSNTTRNGNSLIAPLKSLHADGFIPKAKLPLESWMTWDDYHNPKRITDEMVQLGKESIKRFPINFDRVLEKDFGTVLETEEIITGGFAWSVYIDSSGEYPNTDMPPNHAFILFNLPRFVAFDNYIDEFDGDFIKKLAPDHSFVGFGYRLYIDIINEIKKEPEIVKEVKGLWQFLLNATKKLFKQ